MSAKIATRVVDGQKRPAYENAPIRKTQRMYDIERELQTRRSLMDDLRDLNRDRRAIGEPGKRTGTLVLCGAISTLFMALVFVSVFGDWGAPL